MREAAFHCPSSSGPRWLYFLLIAVFLVAAVQYRHKAIDHRSAFVRWQEQIVQLADGVDIAAQYEYPNPPIMALVLFPLAKLPELLTQVGLTHATGLTIAALVWFVLKAAMTLLVFRWVFFLISDEDRPFPSWACLLAVALSLRPILSDLQHGNVNLFILFLVIAGLVLYVRGYDFTGGLMMGLAIACKVTPALFIPYFVWKRAWRAAAGAVAGLILFLWPGVVPIAVLGADYNRQLLDSWYHDMVYPFVVEGKVTSEHHNQSLPGLAARLLTHSPSFSTYVARRYTPTHYHNLVDLDPQLVRALVKGCMATFALVVVWACRAPTDRRRGWRLGAEFGVILLGMLLFSERTWKHHCVTLVVPFAVLCYFLAVCRPSAGVRAFLLTALVLATVLIATTGTGVPDEKTVEKGLSALFAKQAQVYGAFVLADLVLLGALVFLLRRALGAPTTATVTLPQAACLEKPVPTAQAGVA